MINLLKILLSGRASIKFALGVVLGLAFSMAVILATIGLMDGFEGTMRQGLRKTIGDFSIYSRDGFFTPDQKLADALATVGAEAHTGLLQLEAFALKDGKGKGILLRGVETSDFQSVTSLNLPQLNQGVVLGRVLAQSLNAKESDQVVLSFAQGNSSLSALPTLTPFRVSGEVGHGIYQKDERFAYADLSFLQKSLGLENVVNSVIVKMNPHTTVEQLSTTIEELRLMIGADYTIKPYWSEFKTLLQAVKAEKVMIGLVLQVIVVIAIINAAAFIIFLSESRSQELFLFKALGMSQNSLASGMKVLVTLLWLVSSLLALVFERFFSFLIANYGPSFLPGDIYYVSSIDPVLKLQDFLMVSFGALIWIALILSFSMRQIKRSPVLQGLRKEFS